MTVNRSQEGVVLVAEGSQLRVVHFASLPPKLRYEGKIFTAKTETLGEYDYLRNKNGELVGFSIDISSRQKETLESLAIQAHGIVIDSRQVRFILGNGPFAGDGVQIPTTIYRSHKHGILVAFYKWGSFGKLGFSLFEGDINGALS